ncbi:hypothetical protein FJZ21_03820 [Candidatus Pacearchaeota archaeon]|nr:hypothetical protein [Candidatus Pacearchaeota archaeon]
MSTDRDTDGSEDSSARAFVRALLKPHLGDVPDTKFLLISSNGRFYASVAKSVSGIEGLVKLYLRPIPQRHYEMIGKVYKDSFANTYPNLDLTDRLETDAAREGNNLRVPNREQREYLDKIQSK